MEKLEKYKQFIEKRLSNPNQQEVLSWLKTHKGEDYFVNLGELQSNEESIALAREIYEAGATEVIAVEIVSYDEGENTGQLVIVLPEDAEKRANVFAWGAKQAESLGFDGDEDFGQKHLFVMLD